MIVTNVEGIDSPEDIRDELIAMRARAMGNWPEGIGDTVILSHAIAWLSAIITHNQESNNAP